MKKSILNLGKILNKADQKAINGGFGVNGGECYLLSPGICSDCCEPEGEYKCVPTTKRCDIFGL